MAESCDYLFQFRVSVYIILQTYLHVERFLCSSAKKVGIFFAAEKSIKPKQEQNFTVLSTTTWTVWCYVRPLIQIRCTLSLTRHQKVSNRLFRKGIDSDCNFLMSFSPAFSEYWCFRKHQTVYPSQIDRAPN